ncbi:MAG: DNA-3-methyladenine glycosylase 2 family protein [Actinomycetia bacterium]|nr:DNA-3-methyladenine glycosylase 2 family protein [Actinomycetes bacterium]
MSVSAVKTTGIYCRPGCSAKPKPENTSRFASPVAAEAAGYRSCLRCRPDRHLRIDGPVVGAPPAVEAAMALISDGYLDRFDEDELARRVGYSTRQLRRLFEQHVGATPAFVARSRRAHFARRLLDETELGMPAIAGAAGFGSVRQMNRIVQGIFRFTPNELRQRRRRSDVLTADGGLRLRLPFVEPLHREATLTHLGPRITAGVEAVDGTLYRRTSVTCGNPGVLEVDIGGSQSHLELTAHLPTFDSIIDDVARMRHMFGLDDDIIETEAALGADPWVGPVVRAQPGLRVVGGWDRFETAVRVIVGQQVSVVGASTITARIVERHGEALPAPALGLTHLFPTADRLVDLDGEGLGMPHARARTVGALARAVVDGELDLHATSDADELRGALCDLPGIGPWTAEVVLMRAVRHPDAFPASDLGIRHAVARLLGADDPPTAEQVLDLAEAWRPHRALAAQHLWTSLHPTPEPGSPS